MDESEIMVNEIEKALKQFIVICKENTRCQGVSAPSVTWINTFPSNSYLVQQMLISYIKIIS